MDSETPGYQAATIAANLSIAAGKDPAFVCVAGCDEIEAIEELALAIANHYADNGKRVIVAGCGRIAAPDADLFNVAASGNSIRAESFSNSGDVDVLPFREAAESCNDIVASEAFCNMLTNYKDSYDCVVVAAPFAHKTVDAAVLARMADVSVIAAVVGKTRRKNLRKAGEELRRTGAIVAGVCIVDVEEKASC